MSLSRFGGRFSYAGQEAAAFEDENALADDDYIVRLKRQPPNLHLESATRR